MSKQELKPGNMVKIQSRMWPGINKPGGAGRILKLHYKNEVITHVDVQYVVMGGKEYNIALEYVEPAPDLERGGNALRDRGMILGRCHKCGSLRRDCEDKCDLLGKQRRELRAEEGTRRVEEVSEEESSSDDLESIWHMVKKNRRTFRLWQKKSDDMRRMFIGEEEVDVIPYPQSFSENDSSREASSDNSSDDDSIGSNSENDIHVNSDVKRLKKSILETLNSNETNETHPPLNLNETNDNLDNFLQPEGNAETLPTDILDLTSNLSNEQLLSFFSTIASRQEKEIPKVKSIPRSTLKSNPNHYYQKFRRHLIWNGTDQCRACLFKLQDAGYEVQKEDEKLKYLDRMVESLMRPLNRMVMKLDRGVVVRDLDDPILFRRSEEFKSRSSSRKHTKRKRKKPIISPDTDSSDSISIRSIQKAVPTEEKPFIPSIHKNKNALKNLNETNDYLDGFLQPEGNADILPNDIIDRTANLSDDELLFFFDNLVDELEYDSIPKARLAAGNPQHLYDKFRRELIWNGTDQCRKCLSRLQKGKYRKKLDVRDLRMERVEELVEEIMRPLNRRIAEMDRQEEYWSSDDLPNVFSEVERNESFKDDAHPYATKRRRGEGSVKDRKGRKKQNRKKGSKGEMMKIDKFMKKRRRKRKLEHDSTSSSSSEEDEVLFSSNVEKGKSRMKNGVSYLRRERFSSSNNSRHQGKGRNSTSKSREDKDIYYLNKNQGNASSSSEEDGTPSFPTIKSLFKTLEQTSYTPPSSSTSYSLEDIQTIQAELQNYPNIESASSLLDLQQAIYCKENSNEILDSIGSILKELMLNHGQKSLLHLMNDAECTSEEFILHVTLLQTIVVYIKNTSGNLHPKPEELMDLILLQIIDVIYAHVLPCTWTHLKHHWWEYLKPLCQVLITDMEAVCRVIWTKVTNPKQCVMKRLGITTVFVSIINPVAHTHFLNGDDWNVKKEDTRYIHLSKLDKVSMEEVNALWSLLAYFSAFCKKDESTLSSSYRWRILMLLLLKAPSPVGLELGIHYFSLLLESRVLDPLPKEDSLLIKVLEKALKMYTAEPTISTKKKERIFIKLIQKENPISVNTMIQTLNGPKEKRSDQEMMMHKLLLFDTSLLNTCAHLLSAWVLILPLNKKARRLRFDRAVENCVSNFVFPTESQSSFSRVFGAKDSNKFFFQEIKGVLLWKICSKLDYDSCRKIWKLVSTESMQNTQELFYQHIQGNVEYSFPSHKEASSLASTSFKIVYQMLIYSLQTNEHNEETIFFLFSCLLSSLCTSCILSPTSSSICSDIQTVTSMSIFLKYLVGDISTLLLRKSFMILSDIMKQFIPRLIDVSPLVEGMTADICFRSCMISLQAWTRTIHRSLDDDSINFICGTRNEEQHDYFQDINDDAFLNIDLDALVGAVQANDNDDSLKENKEVAANIIPLKQDEAINELASSHKSLLSFIRNFLLDSKPSTRYSIQDDISNGINNIGKEMLERQADQIAKLMVHLFVFPFHTNIQYLDNKTTSTNDLLFSAPSRSPGDFFQDVLYFQNLNRCISERFCHVLVDYPRHSNAILRRNDGLLFQIMSCFMCSLVDSSILHEFPTSNFALLKKKGGEACRAKEEAILARAQCGEKVQGEDVDIDAACFYRTKKNHVVCRLNVYLCRRIWTFGFNLGKIVSQWGEKTTTTQSNYGRLLLDLSEILTKSYKLNEEYQSTDHVPPQCSLENECWKRIHILNNFLTSVSLAALEDDTITESNTSPSILYIVCAVVRCMAEQTVYTHESVRYFDECAAGKAREERSTEEKYERSKALALLEAFIELAVTFFSCTLRLAGVVPNETNAQKAFHSHVKFLRDFIIVPVLVSMSNEKVDLIALIHASESGGNEIRGIPALPFVLDPSVVRSFSVSSTSIANSTSSRLVESIWKKIRRRLLELVLHIAAGKPDSQSSTYNLYHAVLQRSGLEKNTSKCGKENDHFAVSLGRALHSDIELLDRSSTVPSEKRNFFVYNFPPATILEKCADDYCQLKLNSKMLKTIVVNETEIKHIRFMREFAVKKFLLPKLGFRGVSLIVQCRIMKMLESLLETSKSPSATMLVPTHDSVHVVDYKMFFGLDNACLLAKSLSFCLRQAASSKSSKTEEIDWKVIVELIFSLSCTLITISVYNDTSSSLSPGANTSITLYKWSQLNQSSQNDQSDSTDGIHNDCTIANAANYLNLFFSIMYSTAEILSSINTSQAISTFNLIEKCCQSDSNNQWQAEDDSLFDFATSIDIDFHGYYNLWRSWEEMTNRIYPTANSSYSTTKRNDLKNSYTKKGEHSLKVKVNDDSDYDSSSKLIATSKRFLTLYNTLDKNGDSSEMELS